MNRDRPQFPYSAKDGYQDYSAARDYERERYASLVGRYLYRREQKAVGALVDRLPAGVVIADCPCGTGRWWPVLARRARRIIGIDISEGMQRYAGERAATMNLDIEVMPGEAERLPLDDGSVDYTFSHALTKHLPVPVQYQVLAEFSRIARWGVICSFGVFTHLNYEIWRRRRLVESYPVIFEELEWMAAAAGLRIDSLRKCTSPIGTERTVLLKKST